MHQPGKRISLKEVAALAEVSISTASQALRASGRISPETKARVAEAAQRLGYQKDPLLAQLASKKFRSAEEKKATLLALLPPRRSWSFQTIRWVEACRTLAQGQGFDFSLADASTSEPSAKTAQLWLSQGVRGLMVGNSPLHLPFSSAPWEGLAVVCCGGYHIRALHPTVKLDVAHGLVELWQTALARGGRRIGLAMMQHADPIMDDWIRLGLARELSLKNPEPIPPFAGSMADAEGFTAWVREQQPDTIIGFPQIFGYWLNLMNAPVQQIRRLYLPCLPGDSVSGWIEDPSDVAHEALLQLVQAIRSGVERPPESPRITLIQGRWNEGETCPPR